ncbi:uncharacterized protein [Palaemon carinicauda]|uniref:uncharacterized protein n=1 Tax=Palaemon carinicauda TaxID=392227 RepID=UPI0035B6871C
MDFVMHRRVMDDGEGLDWIGNKKIANLEYADDAVLCSSTPKDLQSWLTRMLEISHEVQLTTNRSKTEMIRTKYRIEEEIPLEGESTNEVKSVKYLRTMISNIGSLEFEFNERLKKASQQWPV